MKYLLIILQTLLLMISCTPIVKTLGPLTSVSIQDSKEKKVFVKGYIEPNNVEISDTIEIHISEIFIEKMYRYKSYNDLSYLIDSSYYQIVLIIEENLDELKCGELWDIKDFAQITSHRFVKRKQRRDDIESVKIEIIKTFEDSSFTKDSVYNIVNEIIIGS